MLLTGCCCWWFCFGAGKRRREQRARRAAKAKDVDAMDFDEMLQEFATYNADDEVGMMSTAKPPRRDGDQFFDDFFEDDERGGDVEPVENHAQQDALAAFIDGDEWDEDPLEEAPPAPPRREDGRVIVDFDDI